MELQFNRVCAAAHSAYGWLRDESRSQLKSVVYTGVHGPSEGIDSISANIFYWTTPIDGAPLNDTSGFAQGKIDRNLYFSSNLDHLRAFLAERREQNSDPDSLVADPEFAAIDLLDVSWADQAPPAKLGITPIDVQRIGLLDDPAIGRLNRAGGLSIHGAESLVNLGIG